MLAATKIPIRRTTAIVLIGAALLCGIGLGRAGLEVGWTTAVLASLVALVSRRSRLGFSLVLLAVLLIGTARTTSYLDHLRQLTRLIGQPVSLSAVIVDDPALSANGYLEFKVGNVLLGSQALPGVITVRTFPTNMHRGYHVSLVGKLGPGFGSVPAELFYPTITVESTRLSFLETIRLHYFAGLRTALPEPGASFGLGLLVGVRGLVPKDLQTQLNLVGLSHLVAVSGYNLTIMVSAAHRVFQRFGRGVALVAALWLIGGFLLITGASASIVRASVVAVLALLATRYGRSFQPLVIIMLSAAVTALVQPGYLTDLGWLLSFIGFFAVMVVAPAVAARLGHPNWLAAQIFIETLTAHVLTIPIVLCYFSQLSIVAPLSNVLVLPLVPLAMLTCFLAGVGGMIFPAFAGWLAWPAALVVDYMLAVVHWLAGKAWASTTIGITMPQMLIMYALLVLGIVLLKQANRRAGRSEEAADVLEGGGLGVARG